MKILRFLFFVGLTALFLTTPSFVYAKTPIHLSIEMKKHTFSLGEKVEGKVIISNSYPATLPAVFWVSLYHEGTLTSRNTTSVEKVFTGTIEIPLKSFGVPDLGKEKKSLGIWHLKIIQVSAPPSTLAQTTFRIVKK